MGAGEVGEVGQDSGCKNGRTCEGFHVDVSARILLSIFLTKEADFQWMHPERYDIQLRK